MFDTRHTRHAVSLFCTFAAQSSSWLFDFSREQTTKRIRLRLIRGSNPNNIGEEGKRYALITLTFDWYKKKKEKKKATTNPSLSILTLRRQDSRLLN